MSKQLSQSTVVALRSDLLFAAVDSTRQTGDRNVLVPGSAVGSAVSVNTDTTGAVTRAILLLNEAELLEVRDASNNPTTDLAPKFQAWLDAVYDGLYGDVTDRRGGQGACLEFDAGNYCISTLKLRPGMSLIGRASRLEVRFIQQEDNQEHFMHILARGAGEDVPQRRTDVFLQDIDFNANGNLSPLGEPISCIYLDAEDDDTDPDVSRTGVIAHRIAASSSSGWGFYSFKRGRNWIYNSQFTNNARGGIYSTGPDQLYFKAYCGANGGYQLHIKSSATPMITEVELGTSLEPQLYESLYLEVCTDSIITGGNCTGRMLIEGAEDDPTANEYNVHTRVNIHNVCFTFKDKTFTDQNTDTVYTLPGYITVKNQKGVHISNCRFMPANDDVLDGGVMTHPYSYRPTNLIEILGSTSEASFEGPLPALDDPLWPCGTPEAWPGSQPTNSYDSITNHKDRLSIHITNTKRDEHAHLFDQVGGLFDKLPLVGLLEIEGATLVPKTAVASNVIDVDLARNDQTLTGNVTWTYSDDAPTDRVIGVTVKASGADRTVTLPVSVAHRDLVTGATVTAFTVAQNKTHFVVLMYLTGNWYIAGYPTVDEWVALAASTSYANDAAAAVGGVTVGQRYRNGSVVQVRIT